MSLLTANGDAVISAQISFPRAGLWTAVVQVDATVIAEGAVELKGPNFLLQGTSYRLGAYAARMGYRIVGGKGKLGTPLKAQAYRGVPLRLPLGDALSEVGEALASTSDSATITRTLARWTRVARTAGTEIGMLVDAASATWKALDDGTMWVGLETWPAFALDYVVTDDPPGDNRMTLAGDDVWRLRPGVTLDGRRLERVELTFSAAKVRAEAWYLA